MPNVPGALTAIFRLVTLLEDFQVMKIQQGCGQTTTVIQRQNQKYRVVRENS